MNKRNWTEEEEKHLLDLNEVKGLKIEEVTYLLNDRHDNARTTRAVNSKLIRIEDDILAKKRNTHHKHGSLWTQEEYDLLRVRFTRNKAKLQLLSEEMGRTTHSIKTKYYELERINTPYNPTHHTTNYKKPKVSKILPQKVDTKRYNTTVFEEKAKVITTNISHLLVGITPNDYTRFDRFYHWVKTRRAAKIMKQRDIEMSKLEVVKLEKQISELREEIKQVNKNV
jgi:ribosomal protein L18|tara:strand:- start:4242 stop:4919 length:678 start_codon:yes stop_codon:yes gene_type:complete